MLEIVIVEIVLDMISIEHYKVMQFVAGIFHITDVCM